MGNQGDLLDRDSKSRETSKGDLLCLRQQGGSGVHISLDDDHRWLFLPPAGSRDPRMYASNDPIIGNNKRRHNNDKEFKKWIEAMFYVGNQIPLVVLNELMNQKFFQDVIIAAKGKLGSGPMPGLSKMFLYDVIISPALQKRGKQSTLDLLHGLQNLVIGPTHSSSI
ncbi:hypothetical protein PHJA_000484100 [Phtheirospermum japonicum]|uniref:Uncharacterized protein n=1 Tax=Phtheirospermum japonicum TaxID=374723 RepID=A0A830B8J4_9LAMI|nr:hypothetical protein PHJA_000484100 [Phtheirospermum japonicum]